MAYRLKTRIRELLVVSPAIAKKYPSAAKQVRVMASKLRQKLADEHSQPPTRLQDDLISLAASRELARRLLLEQIGRDDLSADQIASFATKAAWQANERTKIVRELLAPSKDATAADLYTERVVSKDCSLPLGDEVQATGDSENLADLIADDETGE